MQIFDITIEVEHLSKENDCQLKITSPSGHNMNALANYVKNHITTHINDLVWIDINESTILLDVAYEEAPKTIELFSSLKMNEEQLLESCRDELEAEMEDEGVNHHIKEH